jgi:predicted AAA+ superfamily ATPase
MPLFQRSLGLTDHVKAKSILLLGPRQVGKSTLIRTLFPEALTINLLQSQQLRALATAPETLKDRIASVQAKIVVIDEIQKLPELLNEVHDLIERDHDLRFVLTGSSARKLRRAGVNLLGGRARRLELLPISSQEMQTCPEAYSEFPTKKQAWQKLLQCGGLPSILLSNNTKADLEDYVDVYLQEEIQAEALVRSLPDFARFLNAAALTNTEQVQFTAVGSDAQIKTQAVKDYFQILEDTLVGKLVQPFRHTPTRKAMSTPKFYFFDVGVANSLLKRWNTQAGTPEYGKVFEHLIWRELETAIRYLSRDFQLSYWRSLSQMEVDFILTQGGHHAPSYAIEAKGKTVIRSRDTSGLIAFAQDYPQVRKILVCLEPVQRTTADGVEICPIADFLESLWNGQFFSSIAES